jgi:hypothetical protein
VEVNDQRTQLVAFGGVAVDFGGDAGRVTVLEQVSVRKHTKAKAELRMHTVSETFSTRESTTALRNFSSSKSKPMVYK